MRGFVIMDKETRRKIQSAGGKTAHALGKAHVWTPAEARKAGRKGGKKLKGSKWSKLQRELSTGESLLRLAAIGGKGPTDLSERHDDYLYEALRNELKKRGRPRPR